MHVLYNVCLEGASSEINVYAVMDHIHFDPIRTGLLLLTSREYGLWTRGETPTIKSKHLIMSLNLPTAAAPQLLTFPGLSKH